MCLEAMDAALQPVLFEELALFLGRLELQRLMQLVMGTVDVAAHSVVSSVAVVGQHDVATLVRSAARPQPVFVAHKLPLLFLELNGFRLFFPQLLPATTCLAFLLHSLRVTPYADNPLERRAIDTMEWNRAAESGALRCLGALAEDRQYQLNMQRMTLGRLEWQQVLRLTEVCDSNDVTSLKPQIPAVEWNRESATLR